MVNLFTLILPRFCCQRADQHGKSPTFLEACQQRNRLFPMGVSFAPQKDIQLQFGFNSVYNHFRFTSMWELWNGKVKKGKDKSS